MHTGSEVSIIISFAAGMLTFISPCILPLFPSYISYITGMAFEDLKTSTQSPNIRKLTAIHSLFFIFGFSVVFVFLGITAAYVGGLFGLKRVWLEKIGGVLVILFGMHILGILKLRFLDRDRRLIYRRKKVSYFGSFLIGMVFSVGWTPCVGPILSSILIYATTFESLPRAIMLLSFYSLGLAVPFFIASLAINQFLFIFRKFELFRRCIPVITGLFLILVGGLLFSGQFSRLSGIYNR